MRLLAPLFCAALCSAATLPCQATRKAAKPPDGTKVVSGRHYDLFVAKMEEKPMGAAGYTLEIWQVTAVARTQKHGTQWIKRRVETINSDLLNASSWEVADFDGDGFDDYRYVAEIAKDGCRTWSAERWQPDHDRFTQAPKYARWTDAGGRTLKAICGSRGRTDR